MIELMKQLCALPGPSGCEDAVREFVLKKVKPFADEMKTDAIGNIMVFRKGKKALERPVVLCAHMDEVGVIIKKITDDGMLKFGFVGGVDPRVVIGRPVRFGDVQGVIGIKAVHLTTAAERRTMPKTKDLYIDIGAASKAAAEDKVSLGDYGVFDSAVVEFGDGLIKAKAIDDRVGCAALLKLIEDEPPIDTWFCSSSRMSRRSTPGSASPCRRKSVCAVRQAWHMRLTRDLQWCSRARQLLISQRWKAAKLFAVYAAVSFCRLWTARLSTMRSCLNFCAMPATSVASAGRRKRA